MSRTSPFSKDVKTNSEQLKDVILKVEYQCFSVHVGGHRMLSFHEMLGLMKNARVIYKC